MKIFKVSLILAFMIILCGMTVCGEETPENLKPTSSGDCGAGVKWNYYGETGLLSIEGTGAIRDYEGYTFLPWKSVADGVKNISVGEGVTKIGRFALAGFKNATSVTLPSSVQSIGFNAFYCCPVLTEVSLYNKVEEIDATAFKYCEKLKDLTLYVSEPVTVTASGAVSDPASPDKAFSLPKEIANQGIKISKISTQEGIAVKNESGGTISVNDVIIADGSSYPHTHAFIDQYSSDYEGHRQMCSCGASSSIEKHEFKPAEETGDKRIYKCLVCGFEKKEIRRAAGNKADKIYYICLAAGIFSAFICIIGVILINGRKKELKQRIMKRKERMSGDKKESVSDSPEEIGK